MDAYQLFRKGRLTEAISALEGVLREDANDQRNRTFLFELLCFAGDFDTAEKHLKLLVQERKRESVLGTTLYKSVIHAEKTRQQMFESRKFPPPDLAAGTNPPVSGKLNGKEFTTISDTDHRIGEKLEVFTAGQYHWISYAEISTMQVDPPTRLRDLLWIPARIETISDSPSPDLSQVMIPSMAPLSWQHPDEEVRLGRVSEWCEDESGEVAPYGLKTILVDSKEVPVVEMRTLEIYPTASSHL